MLRWICLFFASSGFTGFVPGVILGKSGKGGGLAGSLVALIMQIIWLPQMSSYAIVSCLIIGSFLLGWLVVGPAEEFMLRMWGPQMRHICEVVEHDFNQTNIDEVHGQFIAGAPLLLATAQTPAIWILLIGFVLFRFFDTVKPWPIKKVEQCSNGSLAIMLDDTIAGLLAAVITTIIMFIFF